MCHVVISNHSQTYNEKEHLKEKYKRYSFRRKGTTGNVLLAKSYAPGNKKFKDKPDAKWNKGHGGNLRIKPPHPKLSIQFVKKKIKRKA